MERKVLLLGLLQYSSLFVNGNSDFHGPLEDRCVDFGMAEIEKYNRQSLIPESSVEESTLNSDEKREKLSPFGASRDDWTRLILLRESLPEESILKTKFEHLIRLLSVAHDQTRRKSSASGATTDRNNSHAEETESGSTDIQGIGEQRSTTEDETIAESTIKIVEITTPKDLSTFALPVDLRKENSTVGSSLPKFNATSLNHGEKNVDAAAENNSSQQFVEINENSTIEPPVTPITGSSIPYARIFASLKPSLGDPSENLTTKDVDEGFINPTAIISTADDEKPSILARTETTSVTEKILKSIHEKIADSDSRDKSSTTVAICPAEKKSIGNLDYTREVILNSTQDKTANSVSSDNASIIVAISPAENTSIENLINSTKREEMDMNLDSNNVTSSSENITTEKSELSIVSTKNASPEVISNVTTNEYQLGNLSISERDSISTKKQTTSSTANDSDSTSLPERPPTYNFTDFHVFSPDIVANGNLDSSTRASVVTRPDNIFSSNEDDSPARNASPKFFSNVTTNEYQPGNLTISERDLISTNKQTTSSTANDSDSTSSPERPPSYNFTDFHVISPDIGANENFDSSTQASVIKRPDNKFSSNENVSPATEENLSVSSTQKEEIFSGPMSDIRSLDKLAAITTPQEKLQRIETTLSMKNRTLEEKNEQQLQSSLKVSPTSERIDLRVGEDSMISRLTPNPPEKAPIDEIRDNEGITVKIFDDILKSEMGESSTGKPLVGYSPSIPENIMIFTKESDDTLRTTLEPLIKMSLVKQKNLGSSTEKNEDTRVTTSEPLKINPSSSTGHFVVTTEEQEATAGTTIDPNDEKKSSDLQDETGNIGKQNEDNQETTSEPIKMNSLSSIKNVVLSTEKSYASRQTTDAPFDKKCAPYFQDETGSAANQHEDNLKTTSEPLEKNPPSSTKRIAINAENGEAKSAPTVYSNDKKISPYLEDKTGSAANQLEDNLKTTSQPLEKYPPSSTKKIVVNAENSAAESAPKIDPNGKENSPYLEDETGSAANKNEDNLKTTSEPLEKNPPISTKKIVINSENSGAKSAPQINPNEEKNSPYLEDKTGSAANQNEDNMKTTSEPLEKNLPSSTKNIAVNAGNSEANSTAKMDPNEKENSPYLEDKTGSAANPNEDNLKTTSEPREKNPPSSTKKIVINSENSGAKSASKIDVNEKENSPAKQSETMSPETMKPSYIKNPLHSDSSRSNQIFREYKHESNKSETSQNSYSQQIILHGAKPGSLRKPYFVGERPVGNRIRQFDPHPEEPPTTKRPKIVNDSKISTKLRISARTNSLGSRKRNSANADVEKAMRFFYRQGQADDSNKSRNNANHNSNIKIQCKNPQ